MIEHLIRWLLCRTNKYIHFSFVNKKNNQIVEAWWSMEDEEVDMYINGSLVGE